MTSVALRPATPADSEFCYQLHKAATGDYVTAIWGWDEQVQRDFHTRAFNPGRWQIITAGGADIGMIDVDYRPTEIYLSRIEIHPDYQGHGIGTRLISALLDDALAQKPRPVLDAATATSSSLCGPPGHAGKTVNARSTLLPVPGSLSRCQGRAVGLCSTRPDRAIVRF